MYRFEDGINGSRVVCTNLSTLVGHMTKNSGGVGIAVCWRYRSGTNALFEHGIILLLPQPVISNRTHARLSTGGSYILSVSLSIDLHLSCDVACLHLSTGASSSRSVSIDLCLSCDAAVLLSKGVRFTKHSHFSCLGERGGGEREGRNGFSR